MPKIEYPAYFEGGLIGCRAKEDIEHREAFIAIPYKMLVTVEAAQRHPVLGPIISDNPQVFSDTGLPDWEQLTLTLVLLYEYCQGEDSYWKPYLDMMPDVKFFAHWSDDMISATQDKNLVQCSIEYKQELNEEWKKMFQVITKNLSAFP